MGTNYPGSTERKPCKRRVLAGKISFLLKKIEGKIIQTGKKQSGSPSSGVLLRNADHQRQRRFARVGM